MRRIATTLVVGAILVAPGVAGCAIQPPPPGAPSPVPTASRPTIQPVPSFSPNSSPSPSPESSSNAEAQAAVDAAMHDAAGRLNLAVGAGDIHVQQVESRQWPDSSLGCPREGVMYSQIVTPGYLVVISAAGKQLEYHADARGRIVFCREA